MRGRHLSLPSLFFSSYYVAPQSRKPRKSWQRSNRPLPKLRKVSVFFCRPCSRQGERLFDVSAAFVCLPLGENNLEAEVVLSLVASSEARPVEVTEGEGDEYERKQRCVEVKVREEGINASISEDPYYCSI